MRFQRLIVESGSNAVTVRFPPRLTVMSGLGQAERESLAGELFGALAGARRGAHLEVLQDNGRRLAILRDAAVGDRVLDLETRHDVTEEFAVDGAVDLATRLGGSLSGLRKLSKLTGEDVLALGASDNLVASLATLDQDQLWAAVETSMKADQQLRLHAEPIGASTDDALLIEQVEHRHSDLERALRRHEAIRHYGIFIGVTSVMAAIPAALLNRYTALPFLAVALCFTIASMISRVRLGHSRVAEQEALSAAGAASYLGFHLQRMTEMLSDYKGNELANAATAHRLALNAWHALVGEDVGVEWALENRNRISQAAERLIRLHAAGVMVTSEDVTRTVEPAVLGQAIVERLAALRRAEDEESIPMVLDEPFVGLDIKVKEWILDLLAQSAGSPQLVFLTNDPDTAAWARRRIVASGDISMIEPAPEHTAPAKPMLHVVA